MIYPKDVQENLKFRAKVFSEGEKDPKFAGLVGELFRRDILFAFNVFFWTYDPRVDGEKDLPFVTFDFQDEVILEVNRAIERGESVFIDKSRDMGITYIVLYVFLWRFLTKKSEEFRIGSRKQEYVDRSGDMDTLFEKLRYQLRLLPGWLLPSRFSVDKKTCSTFMKLVNEEMGNAIIGEATNPDFARGGRKKAIFFDEFSVWEMANESWKSASDATKCKIAVGTPKGAANKFAELSRTDEVPVKMHLIWWKHPHKVGVSEEHLLEVEAGRVKDRRDGYTVQVKERREGLYVDQMGKIRSDWYDDEQKRRTSDDIAENLDCDYLASGRPVFDTHKCEMNRMASVPPIAIGQLVWKIHPVFSERGECMNLGQLSVEFVENSNGNLSLWEYPKSGWENGYAISADCAEGLEQGDYDSARVLRRFLVEEDGPRVVAALHGHLKPFEYAEELAKLGVYFSYAYIAVEREGHAGGAVIENLRKIYRHLYHKEVMTKGFPQTTDRIGWFTTSMTKPVIIGELSKAISQDLYEDPDESFWRETLTFVNNDGKMEAQGKSDGQKCFDDRVMSEAILLWVNRNLPLPTRVAEKPILRGWRKSWAERPKGDLIRFGV